MKVLFSFVVIAIISAFSTLNSQNSKLPEMIFVEGGSFQMGSNNGYDDELPIHKVTVSDFYIGKFEITVGEFKHFCKETGHKFPNKPNNEWYNEHENVKEWAWRDNHPVVNITWYDAIAYCEWLSETTGEKYTLPTEAQWEFAALGGNKSKKFQYAGSDNLNEVAWYDETTYERGTKPVGQLKANELGIFDMSGNAFEWCLDTYGPYSGKSVKDPEGAKKGQYKTVRGGCWYYIDEFCRIAQRDSPKPTLKNFYYGFRVVKIVE